MIPRIVHHIWLGGPLPDRLVGYVESWRKHHPDWQHIMWTGFDWLTNQGVYDRAGEITEHVGQLRSDLARYEILWRLGGVYVDCDLEALRPLDDLLDVECFAGREDARFVNNAVIGCVPGHPAMAALIAAAPESIDRNRGARPNRMTGPHLFTPIAREYSVAVHPVETFYPYHWSELDRRGGDYGDAYTAHHWDNTRKRKGLL